MHSRAYSFVDRFEWVDLSKQIESGGILEGLKQVGSFDSVDFR